GCGRRTPAKCHLLQSSRINLESGNKGHVLGTKAPRANNGRHGTPAAHDQGTSHGRGKGRNWGHDGRSGKRAGVASGAVPARRTVEGGRGAPLPRILSLRYPNAEDDGRSRSTSFLPFSAMIPPSWSRVVRAGNALIAAAAV